MRISDWSSDVCSSDLGRGTIDPGVHDREDAPHAGELHRPQLARSERWAFARACVFHGGREGRDSDLPIGRRRAGKAEAAVTAARSEEHTSELQSLMRISYAVFCLKKKIKHRQQETNRQKKKTIK